MSETKCCLECGRLFYCHDCPVGPLQAERAALVAVAEERDAIIDKVDELISDGRGELGSVGQAFSLSLQLEQRLLAIDRIFRDAWLSLHPARQEIYAATVATSGRDQDGEGGEG